MAPCLPPAPLPPPSPAPCASAGLAPSAPEVYNQNNGQPVVVFAYPEAANELAPADLGGVELAPPALAPSAPGLVLPVPTPEEVPQPAESEISDVDAAQQMADAEDQALPVETLPGSDQPCKVETNTEVIQHPGETFVHHPGSILINQPPTRLIINHAPFLVKPAPIILNQGGKTVTKAITRKYMPGQIQLRPVIIRVVKPIEKKVFIDKPAPPCGSQSYASNPVIPAPCDSYASLPAAPASLPYAGLPIAGLPLALPDGSDAGAITLDVSF